MSDYQGKRFKPSQIPDPAKSRGAAAGAGDHARAGKGALGAGAAGAHGAGAAGARGGTHGAGAAREAGAAGRVGAHGAAPQHGAGDAGARVGAHGVASQQARSPRPATPMTPQSHRRQDTPAAYRPSSYDAGSRKRAGRKDKGRHAEAATAAAHGAPAEPKRRRRSVIPILLIIIGIGLIVAAAAIFINAQIGYKQASDSYQKIEKQYVTDKDGSGVPTIDFNALAQTNPDIVGWIYAPGTNINYPVVQTKDNKKYLNTLFDGTANASGAIFLDCDDTAPGLVDQQTTIYGHHMNDGSMFNVISDTTDQSKFDSIESVYYITRDKTYRLKPLATKVVEDSYSKARTPNFSGDTSLSGYLDEILDGASAKAGDAKERAASASKVVTLVTCRSLSLSNTRAIMVLTPEE